MSPSDGVVPGTDRLEAQVEEELRRLLGGDGLTGAADVRVERIDAPLAGEDALARELAGRVLQRLRGGR